MVEMALDELPIAQDFPIWQNSYSYFLLLTNSMQVTEKGQVTIPKAIRDAAGIRPGSSVSFSLEGGRIIVTPVATHVRNDRRDELREAAKRVRRSFAPEFRQMSADEIMTFLRGDEPIRASGKPRRRSAR